MLHSSSIYSSFHFYADSSMFSFFHFYILLNHPIITFVQVVDAIDSFSSCLDAIEHIKDSISGDHRTIVFQGSCSGSSVQVQNILREPFHTLSLGESITSRGIKS